MKEGGAAKGSRPKRRRPLWWRLLGWVCRCIFLLVVFVVVLVFALPHITNSRPVKNLVRRAISGGLNDAVVELKTLRLAPLDSRLLVIEGLRLAPKGHPDRPVLSIDKVVCDWSPLDLLDGRLAVTYLEVSGVSVQIEERAGKWNVMAVLPAGEPFRIPDLSRVKLPLDVQMGGICARDVTIRVARENGQLAEVGPMSGALFARLDRRLRGTAGLVCVAEKVSASVSDPVAAGFETEFAASMSLSCEDLKRATLSGTLWTRGGRASVGGAASRTPIATRGDLSATLDLARFAVLGANASFTVPGVLGDHLAFSVTRPEGWDFQADNSLVVNFSALGPLADDTPTTPRTSTDAAPAAHLRSLSLDGAAEIRSVIEGSISPGPPMRARAVVSNRITGNNIGFAVRLGLPRPGNDGFELAAEMSGLDVLWHHAAQVAMKDKLAVYTMDDFNLAISTVALHAGDLATVKCNDIFARGTAADLLPDPVNIAVSAALSAGSLAVESPMLGRVELPVDLTLDVRGRNLADPAESLVVLEGISGSLGPALPDCRIEGVLEGYGAGSLRVGGGAVVRLKEALALADGLTDNLKEMIRGAEAEGWGIARFEVAGALPHAGGDAGLDVALRAAASLPSVGLWREEFGAAARGVNANFECALGLGPGFMPVGVRGQTAITASSAAASAGQASASVEDAGFTISAASGRDLTDVSCEFRTSSHGIAASLPAGGEGASFEVGPFDVEAGASARADIRSGEFALDNASCRLHGLACRVVSSPPQPGEEVVLYQLGPLDVEASASARANTMQGDLALEDVKVHIPGVATLSDALLRVEGFGVKHVNARAALDVPDLSSIMAMLPERLRKVLPEVSGAVALRGEADGSVPPAARIVTALREGAPLQTLKQNVLSSLARGEPWPELRLFPLSRFYENAVPLSGSGALELRDVSVRHRITGNLSVALEGLSSQTSFSLRDGALDGEFAFALPALRVSPLAWPLRDFRLSGRCRLDGFDRLRVQDVAFSALNGVVTCAAAGEVSGLSGLRAVPTPASLLKDLSASGGGRLRVDPTAIKALAGWTAEGGAGADLSLRLVAGQSLEVGGAGWLDELSVARSGLLSVEGLTCRVPLAKRWRLLTPQQAEEGALLSERVLADPAGLPPGATQVSGAGWEQRGLTLAVDRLLEPAESLKVRSVSLLGREVLRDLAVSLSIEGESLSVPRLTVGALGGRVVGRMGSWRAGDVYEVRAEGEFDGLDMRRMLPPHLRDIKGDASLSGNVHAEVGIRAPAAEGEQQPVNPIKEIAGELVVTRIGSETLDRALLFIDPEAENPRIVQIRGKLPLANPRGGRVELRRGFVSGQVELQGLLSGLVSSYPVPRFSIVEALASERAGRYLSAFSRLMSMARAPLQALGSGSIVLREEGIEFRR